MFNQIKMILQLKYRQLKEYFLELLLETNIAHYLEIAESNIIMDF